MLVDTAEIVWHSNDHGILPVFSISSGPSGRIATAGADHHIRIWRLSPSIQHLSCLIRHTASVNCVRFNPGHNPDTEMIASAADDCAIYIWRLDSGASSTNDEMEHWSVHQSLTAGHTSDVTSISWSNDSQYVISGEVHHKIIIWDITNGTPLQSFTNHTKFVKGVAWDPMGQFIMTQSCDKTIQLYQCSQNPKGIQCSHLKSIKSIKCDGKSTDLFSDDSVLSYFRRPSWSSDGQFIATPTGQYGDPLQCCTLIWHRDYIDKPVIVFASGNRPTLVAAFSPRYYRLGSESDQHLQPYRQVLACASRDTVTIHALDVPFAIGQCQGLHYSQITDLSWSRDGRQLYVSSTDGYISIIKFADGELGVELSREDMDRYELESIPDPITTTVKANPSTNGPRRITPQLVSVTPSQSPVTISPDRTVTILQPRRVIPTTTTPSQ